MWLRQFRSPNMPWPQQWAQVWAHFVGWLLWFALPVALPVAAAAAAYFYTQGSGFHWPTVISASVGAADLALIFLILIRRISL